MHPAGADAREENEIQERLIPDEVAATIPALGATEECEAPLAAVHLFTPAGGWDWYLTEYDPETGEAFGLVRGIETEWGYFSVSEMEGLNRSRGASLVERDLHFAPRPAGEFE